jgi:hypothetical protein|tara:strand:- start:378 stop:608 length:231 start_codon:yes stop_codon:yes gene_type:complete
MTEDNDKNDKQEINIEQENIMLKAELDRMRNLAGNRLLIMRRLEQFANDVNVLMNALRADFAEVQAPVDESEQGEQ